MLSINIIHNKSFHFNFSWYFSHDFNDSISEDFISDDFFLIHWFLDHSISDDFNWSLNFNVDIFNGLYFNWPLLDDWNLNNLFNLTDNFFDNLFFNHNLYDLRYFDDLFNNSWDNNYFFNDFFNLYDLWYLYHFFNDLVYLYSNLFDSFDNLRNLYYLLFNVFNWSWNINIMVNYLIYFDNLWFINYNRIINLYLNNLSLHNSFNNRLGNNFWYFHYSLLNNWNLYSLFNYLLYLFDEWNHNINHFLNLFDSILNYYLLSHHRDLSNLFLDSPYLNYLFNYLWNLNDSLFSLDNWNWFFYYLLNYFMLNLNVRNHFFFNSVFYSIHDLFYYSFNFHNLRYLNNFFNYSFNKSRHFNNFLNNSLNWDYFLNLNNYLSYLWHHVIYLSFNFYYFINLDYLLNYPVNFNNLRNFSDNFNWSLKDSWYFNYLFNYLLDGNNFLHNIIDHLRDLNWYIHYTFNFLDFFNLDNFLNDFFNRNDLRYLHYSIYYTFNNFLNLDNLRNNSKDFKDIIYIYNTHNFLIDHSNYSFIKFWNISSLCLKFSELFKKSFN